MKKLTLLIVLAFIIHATASSQPCLPEGITFTTQAEIDNFQTNQPNCTEIEGDVEIHGNDITNLNGLNVLTAFGGSLLIGEYYSSSNPVLTSLTGLDNVTSIAGRLCIYDNIALTSLTGLDNVSAIEGDLSIWYNDTLISLTGLENLTSIGETLSISHNDAITSLTGLDNVISIEENVSIVTNFALTSLTGLDNVTYIGGDLYIEYNDALTSLTGLDNVTSIGGDLDIYDNAALTSLTGLDNVNSIGGFLSIWYNAALTSLTGLDNLNSIGGYFYIESNIAMTSLTGLDNVTSIGGGLYILTNSALTSLIELENVTSIGGDLNIESNDALTSLTGLDNVSAASIVHLSITDNYSLSNCEVQNICNYLANPNGTINIYGNATACNNPPEVANACGIILPCLPYGNYYFYTQNEIEDFQTNYPDCTELEGYVEISGSNISNLSGLNVITTIGGDFFIRGNNSLISLTGLDNVTSIGGILGIFLNDSLTSLTSLDNVTSTGGYLWIKYNDALTSLTGLENIDAVSINYLWIANNPSLSTCEVQSVCDYLASPNGFIEIYDNATGCNSQEEVEEACEALWVPNINVESEFLIYPNPAKKELFISCNNGTIIKEVNIYNQVGQKVLHKKRITKSIDVSKLRQGMYIIELVTNDSKIREKLIIR